MTLLYLRINNDPDNDGKVFAVDIWARNQPSECVETHQQSSAESSFTQTKNRCCNCNDRPLTPPVCTNLSPLFFPSSGLGGHVCS